jgi:hypothetical protein
MNPFLRCTIVKPGAHEDYDTEAPRKKPRGSSHFQRGFPEYVFQARCIRNGHVPPIGIGMYHALRTPFVEPASYLLSGGAYHGSKILVRVMPVLAGGSVTVQEDMGEPLFDSTKGQIGDSRPLLPDARA